MEWDCSSERIRVSRDAISRWQSQRIKRQIEYGHTHLEVTNAATRRLRRQWHGVNMRDSTDKRRIETRGSRDSTRDYTITDKENYGVQARQVTCHVTCNVTDKEN